MCPADAGDPLAEDVDWDASTAVRVAPVALLGAMRGRAAPRRAESHELPEDLADLQALLRYVAEHDENRRAVRFDGAAIHS